jgi:hypothetical protein
MARGGSRSLVLWSWIVLALLGAHDLTHIFDDGLHTGLGQLALVAIPQWLVLGAVMAIIVRGDGRERQNAALLLGISVAVGFAVIHLLPVSPAAYWDLQPSFVSWVLAWVPAAAGLVLAVLAWPPQRAGVSSRPLAARRRG